MAVSPFPSGNSPATQLRVAAWALQQNITTMSRFFIMRPGFPFLAFATGESIPDAALISRGLLGKWVDIRTWGHRVASAARLAPTPKDRIPHQPRRAQTVWECDREAAFMPPEAEWQAPARGVAPML